MQRATKDLLYFETVPDNAPTLHVEPGEKFEVETQINRVPWLDDHPDREALEVKLRGGNPSSGCIYVEGAEPGQMLIVHIGDMHARQGDGEVCGAGGIEAGGRVRIRCELTDLPSAMIWSRITNDTHIMIAAQARPAEDAFRIALEEMVIWLEDDYGFSRGEAYLFLGQVLEERCTQYVDLRYLP
ncbi:MAG: acetamidase/formamidase family protein [SAR202 cluster bacterium]|nr:acetamidase/formamidase family protein [SAR202 cluster bacterium]